MIIEPNQLYIFIPAALALNLTPGVDMMFCLGQGLKSGPKAGVAASFGITTGGFVHIGLAAFGLAALLAIYPIAFEAIRWAGIVYLLWLALQVFIKPLGKPAAIDMARADVWQAWRNGVVVSVLNPKVAIFILAFVPQFVDASRGSAFLQFLLFGGILSIGGAIINGLVGGFSGSIGAVLTGNKRLAQLYRSLSSAIFVGLAAKLAFDQR